MRQTSFVKLITRLADPWRADRTRGSTSETWRPRRRGVDPWSPRRVSVRRDRAGENVRYGLEGATDRDAEAKPVEELGLRRLGRRLADGLDTRVGERGEALSVGERQLVALARAQIGDPGL